MEGNFDAGLYTGENGIWGVELGSGLGVYGASVDNTYSTTIFGINVGYSKSASIGVGSHGRGAALINTTDKTFELTLHFDKTFIGGGGGGFSISNMNQKRNKRKKRKNRN